MVVLGNLDADLGDGIVVDVDVEDFDFDDGEDGDY